MEDIRGKVVGIPSIGNPKVIGVTFVVRDAATGKDCEFHVGGALGSHQSAVSASAVRALLFAAIATGFEVVVTPSELNATIATFVGLPQEHFLAGKSTPKVAPSGNSIVGRVFSFALQDTNENKRTGLYLNMLVGHDTPYLQAFEDPVKKFARLLSAAWTLDVPVRVAFLPASGSCIWPTITSIRLVPS